MNLYEEFGRVVDVLADAGIEYALCGGVAVAFHGYARFTRDSAGGLAQMKRLAGRGQDLVDLAQLEGDNGEI